MDVRHKIFCFLIAAIILFRLFFFFLRANSCLWDISYWLLIYTASNKAVFALTNSTIRFGKSWALSYFGIRIGAVKIDTSFWIEMIVNKGLKTVDYVDWGDITIRRLVSPKKK